MTTKVHSWNGYQHKGRPITWPANTFLNRWRNELWCVEWSCIEFTNYDVKKCCLKHHVARRITGRCFTRNFGLTQRGPRQVRVRICFVNPPIWSSFGKDPMRKIIATGLIIIVIIIKIYYITISKWSKRNWPTERLSSVVCRDGRWTQQIRAT